MAAAWNCRQAQIAGCRYPDSDTGMDKQSGVVPLARVLDGIETAGPVAMDSFEAEPPGYGSPRARSLPVDLKAMSTLDPAVAAMYEASDSEAKSSAAAGPEAAESAVVPAPAETGGDLVDVSTESVEQRRLRFERDAMQYVDQLYSAAMRMARNPSDAEDLVQRVFLKMIEALPRYEPRGIPFAAWVFRLARNTVIDFERTRRTHDPLDAIEGQASDAAGPDALAELEQERAAVRAAIATLTPDQQDVVTYRFFAGLRPAEIAALMNRREGSVRALQFRAIEALRERLGPDLATAGLPPEVGE